jgi:hypothetical protein
MAKPAKHIRNISLWADRVGDPKKWSLIKLGEAYGIKHQTVRRVILRIDEKAQFLMNLINQGVDLDTLKFTDSEYLELLNYFKNNRKEVTQGE